MNIKTFAAITAASFLGVTLAFVIIGIVIPTEVSEYCINHTGKICATALNGNDTN